MDYKNYDFWTMGKLWRLRQEIVLGSMYYSHYENSFGIPEKVCCDFFDSFIEWCFIVEGEKENGFTEYQDIYKKYDNAMALWDYFCGIERPFGE